MKSFTVLFSLGLITICLSSTETYPRGCRYILGRCVEGCPEGTHGYSTGCGYLTPEATCEEPNPVQDTRGQICDYSACYCDAGTVRNKKNKKCVPLDQCDKE